MTFFQLINTNTRGSPSHIYTHYFANEAKHALVSRPQSATQEKNNLACSDMHALLLSNRFNWFSINLLEPAEKKNPEPFSVLE